PGPGSHPIPSSSDGKPSPPPPSPPPSPPPAGPRGRLGLGSGATLQGADRPLSLSRGRPGPGSRIPAVDVGLYYIRRSFPRSAVCLVPRKGREDAMATRQDSTTQAAPAAGLAAQLQAGDQRALARALSWVENDHPLKEALLARCPPSQGTAYRVGITGPPGAGKSTLINGLIAQGRAQGWRVAVVAVDPTSPFTGGGVLGGRLPAPLGGDGGHGPVRVGRRPGGGHHRAGSHPCLG